MAKQLTTIDMDKPSNEVENGYINRTCWVPSLMFTKSPKQYRREVKHSCNVQPDTNIHEKGVVLLGCKHIPEDLQKVIEEYKGSPRDIRPDETKH